MSKRVAGSSVFSCGERRVRLAVDRPAFTLIELLVVVAIISLLISILLPSLGEAREQAKTVKCGSSLSGIGKGIEVCRTENRDFGPTWDDGVAAGAPSGFRSHYLYTWGETLFDMGYVGDRNAFLCPSDKLPDRPVESRGVSGNPYSKYGWVDVQGTNVPPTSRKPGWRGSYGISSIMHANFREDLFQDPARQVYIADGWWCWFSAVGATNVMAQRVLPSVPSLYWPSDGAAVAWRHGRNLRGQFLYRDGHVGTITPKVPRNQVELLNSTVDTVNTFTWLPGESASRSRESDYRTNLNPERIVEFDTRSPRAAEANRSGSPNRRGAVNHAGNGEWNWTAAGLPEELNANYRTTNRLWKKLPSDFPGRF